MAAHYLTDGLPAYEYSNTALTSTHNVAQAYRVHSVSSTQHNYIFYTVFTVHDSMYRSVIWDDRHNVITISLEGEQHDRYNGVTRAQPESQRGL